MEIRNKFINKDIGFGNSLIIKTKKTLILNTLEEKDCREWRSRQNPKFRYTHMSLSGPDKDGFYRGIIMDKVEKNAFHGLYNLSISNIKKKVNVDPFADAQIGIKLQDSIASLSKTIELQTMEQLDRLLQLKNVNNMIKSFVK